MAALVATRRAVAGTTITIAAHESAIAASMTGGNTTAADSEAVTVRVHFDRLDLFQKHFVDDIFESIDLKNMVALFGLLQGNTERTNTAASQFDEQPYGSFFLVFKMFSYQLRRPGSHFKPAVLSPIRLVLFYIASYQYALYPLSLSLDPFLNSPNAHAIGL